jgi:predicted metal-dependent phosphoesterase TrpH
VIFRIDPHVHTNYSNDGTVSIDEVIPLSKRKGLNGVFILDHNTIEGALKLQKKAPEGFVVIVGEEIKTTEGEIGGLFLKELVPPGLSPEETIDKIRSQGGLICITHPFCRFRRSRLEFEAIQRIIKSVDIIEIFNSRNLLRADNKKAYSFAKANNKLMMVGSDAHIPYEYGRSYLIIPAFHDAEEFKKYLSSAEYMTRKSPLWVHFAARLKIADVRIFPKHNSNW